MTLVGRAEALVSGDVLDGADARQFVSAVWRLVKPAAAASAHSPHQASGFEGLLLRTLPCGKHFALIDPATEFLTFCLITFLEAVLALALLLPILVVAGSLRRHEKGPTTFKGQLAAVLALVLPLLRLTDVVLRSDVPTWGEWAIIAGGVAAATLVNVQDGRVRVSSPESLLYWSASTLTTLFLFVNAVVNRIPTAWLRGLLLLVTAIVFYAELTNKRVKGTEGHDTANIFDRISLQYVGPILQKGGKPGVRLTRSDFPPPPQGFTALGTYDRLHTRLTKFSTANRYRLILSLFAVNKRRVVGVTLLTLVSELSSYLRPIMLALFLRALAQYVEGDVPIFYSVYFGILYGVVPAISAATANLATVVDAMIYVQTRTSLTGLIYRKALTLGPKGREEYDSAKIMNLLNVDTEMIDGIVNEIPNLVSAPCALFLATWQLWLFLGPTMFAAVPVYLIFLPFSGVVSKVMWALWPESMKARDERTKATADLFRNIKSVKLYAWEIPFYKRVVKIRVGKELKIQRKFLAWMGAMNAVWTSMSDYVAAAVFVAYLWRQQGILRPEIVFPCLGLLSYATVPFMRLPMSIMAVAKAITSQTRINELLLQKDQDSANYYQLPASAGFVEESVAVADATVSWNGESEERLVALRGVSFSASHGDLVCITGKTGSGKTALLRSICDELKILSGSVTVKGTLAYCPQEPWLQNKTLKENILFGTKLDEEYYQKTLEACDLVQDLKVLPKGDDTDVGERGISLSGGQKARVALARAVYSRADVVVLDDVLSAVDEHVSSHLIKNLLSKDGLLSQKTIILATNNIKVLPHASRIVALENKTVIEQASFAQVVEKKETSQIYRLVKEYGTGGDIDSVKPDVRKEHIARTADAREPSRSASIDDAPPVLFKDQDDEEQENEAVSLSIFKRYVGLEGVSVVIAGTLVMTTSVVITNAISIWLGVLSNHELTSLVDGRFYVIIYISLALASSILIFGSVFWFVGIIGVNISRKLHNRMLMATIRSPMSFFDHTPLGRVINRFTGDVEKLDNTLPVMLYYFVRSCLNAAVCLIIVIVAAPVTILAVIPLVLLTNYYRRIFVPSSRQISRMSSASNSPILSHIEESVKGSAVVRAFDRKRQFVDTYEYRTDYWIELNFLRQTVRAWLNWRIQAMSNFLDVVSTFVMIFLVYKGWLSVGFVGVAAYNASRLSIMVRQIISIWADLEVAGVSLDRILEYTDREQEAAADLPDSQPSGEWPASGKVEFENFSVRYKPDGPDVLKNLSFAIQNQEKIGIVGRTGSGKSTLTLSLFRLMEANGGKISIDGVDSSKLGLTYLRSKLSIIPQDAQIFGGTLRENLDPFEYHDDTDLWRALEMCHLKQHFVDLGTGLETPLTEGGGNLSRGQAQLICLGRALLNDAKILVMDEATASVDVETDRIVQETIRSQFKDRTIITIAHRLHTIADSDRVLVLDKGEIAEFDTPSELLKQKGHFYSLTNAGKSDELNE